MLLVLLYWYITMRGQQNIKFNCVRCTHIGCEVEKHYECAV
jgi:hypothetical protein